MSKTAKIIAVILILIFMLTGCENIPITHWEKSDIENIKNQKEQKIDKDIYEEFLMLFKGIAEFDFEKYFFIPEEGRYTVWNEGEKNGEDMYDSSFVLYSAYVIPKAQAEELLEILRNNDSYQAYYNKSDMQAFRHETPSFLNKGRENRSKCYYFKRGGLYVDTKAERYVDLGILPIDNTCNMYTVDLSVQIAREPPQGKEAWPDDFVVNHYRMLLDPSGKPMDDVK